MRPRSLSQEQLLELVQQEQDSKAKPVFMLLKKYFDRDTLQSFITNNQLESRLKLSWAVLDIMQVTPSGYIARKVGDYIQDNYNLNYWSE